MYCGKCGKKIDDDSEFCPYCGNPVHQKKEELVVKKQERKPVSHPVQKQKFFTTKAGEAVIAVAIGVASFSGGFAWSVNKKPAEKENTGKSAETEKNVKPFTANDIQWVKKPGSLDISGYENLEAAGHNGFVFIKEGFKENKGYGTEWTNPDMDTPDYDTDAIVVKNGNKEGIYSYEGEEMAPVKYVNIGWNYYMDFTFTYQETDGKSDYSFDKNFNTTGQLQRDQNKRTYELPHFRAVSDGKIVNDVKNGKMIDNGDGNTSENQILPVINKNIFTTVDASKKLPYSYDADYSKLPDAVTGFAVKNEEGKIIDLPEGMKPTYWDDFIAIYAKPDNKTFVDTYRDQEAYVNGVIKLTDGKKVKLWDVAKKDYLSKDSFDDATYFEDGYIGVEKDGKWGFMDENGKMVSDDLFDSVSAVHKGKAYVTYKGKVGIIDLKASLKQ